MKLLRTFARTAVCAAIVMTTGASGSRADVSQAAALFLKIENSARAAGMGRITSVLADPRAPLYNPGAMGLFHLDHVVAASFPSTNDWLPAISDDGRIKSQGISLGGSLSYLGLTNTQDFNLGLAAGYSLLRLGFGPVNISRGPAQTLPYESYDMADCYSIGAAAQIGRFLDFGIGYTHKEIKSVIVEGAGPELGLAEARGTAHDWGFMIRLDPVSRLLPERSLRHGSSCVRLAVVPVAAYVKSNVGDDLQFLDAI